MTKHLKRTERGFLYAKFRDTYDQSCSIQESSLATDACLWLGRDENAYHGATGQPLSPRMHIDQTTAKWMIRLLQRFVERGGLRNPRR